ncbi:A/G-specific adenine glycosylase [Paucibacter sp. APW11]|uniref:Adenine DNA glycosylase n=1 Tax=Roseateles aquae TaxID=3077235 RepID=A0ABU3PD21_9BURK|nr:A/G-specific adenine glycosylase [Paucibacter sp. APW11]MDT9000215.1 A/G-specific adenine glycosylase [Paucibacter sp. APW11]
MSESRVQEIVAQFAPTLVAWQRQHGRHELPWQQTRDPYRVWLSEIMLQQTQVTTVLGYYQRFLERFPTVRELALAELDEVLALWAGLGYYSRARNLHRCAQAVLAEHGGEFPRSAEQLQQLPGIGRSTAAAVASFCFDERVAILDGNVKRVLSRVLAFDGDLASAAQEKLLWRHADALLPARAADMPAYTQGLMDLGASLCASKTPQCLLCPLSELCAGRAQGEPQRYPIKSRKLKRGRREHWWLWLEHEERIWLQQRPDSGVWAGLWTLPLFDSETELLAEATRLGAEAEPLPRVEHALTHFDWVLHPRRALLNEGAAPLEQGRWVAREQLASYALPAPLKRLIG